MEKDTQKRNLVAVSVFYIIVGTLFCIFRSGMVNIMLTIIGALLLVFGLLKCLAGKYLSGAIEIVIGVVTIFGGWFFVEFVFIFVGALLVLRSLIDIVVTLKNQYYKALVAPAIILVIGILFIVCFWALVDWLFIIMGIIAIAGGVSNLIIGFKKEQN